MGILTSFIAERIYRNIPSMHAYLSTDTYAPSISALRYAGLSNDSNYTAMLVLIYLCLVLSVLENFYLRKNQKILIIVSALIVTVFTFFTVSKMFYLGLIIIAAYTFGRSLIKLKLSRIIKYLSVLGMFVYISNSLGFFEGIIYRISSTTSIESMTTGRSSVLNEYYNLLFSNGDILFLGIGMYDRVYFQDISAHNTFVSAIYQMGILGLVFVYIPMLVILVRRATLSLNIKKVNKNLVSVIILSLSMVSLDILMYEGLPLIILITVVCIMQHESKPIFQTQIS